MAKPICVIYYNPEMNGSMRINHNQISESMQQKMPDYYVFCVPSYQSVDGSAEQVEFKVFHEKDFTEIQYEELKKIIVSSI